MVEGIELREGSPMKRILVSVPDEIFYALMKRQNETGAPLSTQVRRLLQNALGVQIPKVEIPEGVKPATIPSRRKSA